VSFFYLYLGTVANFLSKHCSGIRLHYNVFESKEPWFAYEECACFQSYVKIIFFCFFKYGLCSSTYHPVPLLIIITM
jgi:hypothetical protein